MLFQNIKSYCDYRTISNSLLATKIYLILVLIAFSGQSFGQTTLYSENFDAGTAYFPATTSTTPWKTVTISGSYGGSSTQNKWAVFYKPTALPSQSLNMYVGGTDLRYSSGIACNVVVYDNTSIDASTYNNITISFKWKAGGEVGNVNDYLIPVYSTNGGTTWNDAGSKLTDPAGYANYASISNLSISACSNTTFKIGFRWVNNGSLPTAASASGPAIDDIVVKGDYCAPPAFAVNGGGTYCTGGSGLVVGLSGSTSGVNYQLKLNGTNTGSAVVGTGSAINFPLQTGVGTYTVVASGGGYCGSATMTGSTTVATKPVPTIVTAGSAPAAFCSGGSASLSGSAVGVTSVVNYINESFGSASLPSGWTATASAVTLGVTNTNNAGGSANEITFGTGTSGSGTTYTSRLTFGPFSTIGETQLNLSFKTSLLRWGTTSSITASIETSTNGSTWVATPWSKTITTTNYVANESITLNSTHNVGSGTFYISIKVTGRQYYLNRASFDNIVLSSSNLLPVTYAWTGGSFVSGQNTATPTVNPSSTTTYTMTATSGGCDVTSNVLVTVNPSTSISTQPTVPTEVCTSSGTQTFSVVATGLSLSYSWRKNGTPVSNGGVISGQGTATLTLTNPTTSDAGSYDVVVSGTCGNVTSSAVTNVVNPTNPIISTQPLVPTEVCTGSGIQTFSVVASGPSLTYSWRKDGSPVSNGGVISGQGTATLTLTSPTTADIGSYDVVVSGTCGNITSSAVSNNVNTTSTVGTISSDQSICVGAIPGALSLTSNNGTIQWQVSSDNSSFSNISGANASSLSGSAMGSILATTYYRANVTNGACSSIQSNVVTISTPSSGTNLGNNGDQATCRVKDGAWIHFYNSGRLLVSLSCVDDLGDVDVTSYVGTPLNVAACDLPTPYYTTATLGRNWVIERDAVSYPISNPILVRLPFDANEMSDLQAIANTNQNPVDNVIDISSFKLSKYSGPNNVDNDASNNCTGSGGDGGTTIHAQTGSGLVSSYSSGFSADGKYLEFSVSGFSEFWLHGSGNPSPLPIEFIGANIHCDENKNNTVKWRTASEKNSDYFTVEKSTDLFNWLKIGTVKAQGNSNIENNYSFTDINKNISVIYYRISQTDLDGKTTTFGPWSSECLNENVLNVYPNPNDGIFNLQISTDKKLSQTQMLITDSKGVIHYSENLEISEGNNNFQLNLKNLNSGIYLIYLKDYENSFIPIKFVVN